MPHDLKRPPDLEVFYTLKQTLNSLRMSERGLQLLVERGILKRYRWGTRSYFRASVVRRLAFRGIPDKRFKSGLRPVS